MPKPYGFTITAKVEGWLRQNSRTNASCIKRYTFFTVSELAQLLGLKKSSIRQSLKHLEANNRGVCRSGKLNKEILWENSLVMPKPWLFEDGYGVLEAAKFWEKDKADKGYETKIEYHKDREFPYEVWYR